MTNTRNMNDIPVNIDVLPGDQLRAVRFGLLRYRMERTSLLHDYGQVAEGLDEDDPFNLGYTGNICGDLLCEFANSEDIETFEFEITTHGELLEHVPDGLMSLFLFAADVRRGTLEPNATFALDETQQKWVLNFCLEQMGQLCSDINAVCDLENQIESKLASRRTS